MSHLRQQPRDALIRTFGLRFTHPKLMPPSSAEWHQFVIAVRGPLNVASEGATWLVPPGAGIWVPAGKGCSFRNRSEATVRMLYLPSAPTRTLKSLSDSCEVLAVSPFFRELVEKVVLIGALSQHDTSHRHLAALVWEELAEAKPIPSALVQPVTATALHLVDILHDEGFRLDALPGAIRKVGTSRRTLERAFVRETHLTLGEWLTKRRVQYSMELLHSDASVADVAFALGYNAPSAFIAMFKREVGETPKSFQKRYPFGR